MKITILALAGACLFTHIAQAQNIHTASPARHAKTTSSSSRLIASVSLACADSAYYPVDSSRYHWSGGRAGDLTNIPELKDDNTETYTYDTGTSSYTDLSLATQTFDAANNILSYIVQNWDGATWVNYDKHAYTYDAANNELTEIDQLWDVATSAWVNYYNVANTYNATNQLLTQVLQMWSGTTWVNNHNSTFTYDGAGNMLNNLSQSWDIAGGDWLNGTNEIYTYTTAGKEATYTDQYWAVSDGWLNGQRITNTYDATNNLTTSLTQIWESAAWVNTTQDVYSNFTVAGPQTHVSLDWNGTSFDNATKDTITYNSHGQVTSLYEQTWDGTAAWTPTTDDNGARYYYEDYTTSVKNVTNTNCNASVYPVPAKDMLHVSVTWNEPQAFSTQIMDMSGRMVSQWQMPESKSYDGNITISNLPAGNYIMKMTGTKAQSTQQIIIAK